MKIILIWIIVLGCLTAILSYKRAAVSVWIISFLVVLFILWSLVPLNH